MAVLGLRSLYFVLVDVHRSFAFVKYGVEFAPSTDTHSSPNVVDTKSAEIKIEQYGFARKTFG